MNDSEKNYDDMLYMTHPTSINHPRMAPEKRAAQFAPFSALTGYEESIEKTARQYEEEILNLEKGKEIYD